MNRSFSTVFRILGFTVVGSLWGLFTPSVLAQNLFVNGSFEAGNYTGNADGQDLAVGASDLTGWAIQTSDVAWFDNANSHGFVASSGSKSLDLTGYSDSVPQGAVAQTITTGAGGIYQIAFDLGAQRQSPSAAILVTVQDTASSTILASQSFGASTSSLTSVWTHFSLDFTALGANTEVRFAGNLPGSISIGLDNVTGTVLSAPTATPEPSAMLMLGTGVLLLQVRRLRRRRRVTSAP